MNILVLEDRGSVSKYMVETLQDNEEHKVFEAWGVYDATTYWEDEDIQCLVVDVNLDPEGLDDNVIASTLGGLLTGWIWLKTCVFSKRPSMRERTIIYTDYVQQLMTNVDPEELAGILVVPKRGVDPLETGDAEGAWATGGTAFGPAERMLARVRTIAEQVEGDNK